MYSFVRSSHALRACVGPRAEVCRGNNGGSMLLSESRRVPLLATLLATYHCHRRKPTRQEVPKSALRAMRPIPVRHFQKLDIFDIYMGNF